MTDAEAGVSSGSESDFSLSSDCVHGCRVTGTQQNNRGTSDPEAVIMKTAFGHPSSPEHVRRDIWDAAGWSLACILASVIMGLCVLLKSGHTAAYEWGSAYFVVWVLALDNLLAFLAIYEFYRVPTHLKSVALGWGFLVCMVLQLGMLTFAHQMRVYLGFSHVACGVLLVALGLGNAYSSTSDERELDLEVTAPTRVTTFLMRYCRVLSYYVDDGSFVVKVPVSSGGKPILPTVPATGSNVTSYGTISVPLSRSKQDERSNPRYFGTMLLWVVICQELTDAVFTFDSVTLVTAQVEDLFRAYTATIFALGTIRSLFFILNYLMMLIGVLKYIVAIVLVFMGTKLILVQYVHISHEVMFLITVASFGVCVLLSVVIRVIERRRADAETIATVMRRRFNGPNISEWDDSPRSAFPNS